MPPLPMEMWAHIASFIPFHELHDTFWALRMAWLLPPTHTPPGNALLQFCTETRPVGDGHVAMADMEQLNAMGFDMHLVEYAASLHPGNLDAAIDFLLHATN